MRAHWPGTVYQNFDHQAAIDMLDIVSSGLLAQLASHVIELKCDFIVFNDEADGKIFPRMYCMKQTAR